MKKLVSVVIPMYNSEKTIINTLESVFNQCYKNLEVIIINDGSNDSSKKTVERYMEDNINNVIKLIDQENAGVSAARNRGIGEAKGDYIAFLDSDDIWVKNKITRQMETMEQHSDIVLLGTLPTNNRKKHIKIIDTISFNQLLFKNYFVTSSVILKKEILLDVGLFNIDKNYSEDYELWLRISAKYRVAILNEGLTIYSEDNEGLSSNLICMQKGELENYYNLYRNKKIKTYQFIIVTLFSMIKFFRRLIIVRFKIKGNK